MSPPATVQQDGKLFTMLQDTLRGATLDGPGIYDRQKVVRLLDAMPAMDASMRNRVDPMLMWMSSICLLHEQLRMSDAIVAPTPMTELPKRRRAS